MCVWARRKCNCWRLVPADLRSIPGQGFAYTAGQCQKMQSYAGKVTGMSVNTQRKGAGLFNHSPSFSKLCLFAGPKLDSSIRPKTQHMWKRSQFPFSADVNRLCRSHQQHHGAHLHGRLTPRIDRIPVSSWARSNRRKAKKETTRASLSSK